MPRRIPSRPFPKRTKRVEGPTAPREAKPLALTPARTLHTATYGGSVSGVGVGKTAAKRNRALLDMAQGRRCLLRVDGVCTGDTATTVACHSNLSAHGKAAARKADDQYSVWGCMACHRWLDTGPAQAVRKEHVFHLAHLEQRAEWYGITHNLMEPERFRKAAQWALDNVGGTTE